MARDVGRRGFLAGAFAGVAAALSPKTPKAPKPLEDAPSEWGVPCTHARADTFMATTTSYVNFHHDRTSGRFIFNTEEN